jgi:hypothetical protein
VSIFRDFSKKKRYTPKSAPHQGNPTHEQALVPFVPPILTFVPAHTPAHTRMSSDLKKFGTNGTSFLRGRFGRGLTRKKPVPFLRSETVQAFAKEGGRGRIDPVMAGISALYRF